MAYSQTGIVLEEGDSILDPNQDGYITLSGSSFSTDGYDVDEFELPMFGIPIFAEGEAVGDVSGKDCSVTDLSLDSAGYALYAYLDDNKNLIFRFRLGGDRNSVESYSVLVDIDNLIGEDDPNSTSENPGFEYAITLIQRSGVYVYDIDGVTSCPTAFLSYDHETNQQKSLAGTFNCDDEDSDIFIDFYIPFQDLTDATGLTTGDPLRFTGLTNTSATCPLGGAISDIGGVDDTNYGGCFECAVLDLTDNQCSVPLDSLCADCNGFPEGPSAPPVIQKPVQEGDVIVQGKADPDALVYIDIFDNNDVLYYRDTVISNSDSLWVSDTFSPALELGDSIVVFAASPGKCNSGLSILGTNFALVLENQPPVIASEGVTTYQFIENGDPLQVDSALVITDDDITLTDAYVQIYNNYLSTEDTLIYSGTNPDITSSWNEATGRLSLTGLTSLSDYKAALSSIFYSNKSDNLSSLIRGIRFWISDGDLTDTYEKNILVSPVNDAPYFFVTDNSIVADTITFQTNEDESLDFCANVFDIEGDEFYIQTLAIDDPASTGSITDVDVYDDCLLYEPEDDLNGVDYFELKVCDKQDSICTTSILKIEIFPVNDDPVIVQFNDPIDTLSVSTIINSDVNICIETTDIENNNTSILRIDEDADPIGTTLNISGLCFDYSPNLDEVGLDFIEVIVGDDGAPQGKDTVIVRVSIESSNLPPDIVDENDVEIDTVEFAINADSLLNYCFEYTDPNEFDVVSVSDVDTLSGDSEISFLGQCVDVAPKKTAEGLEYYRVILCDNGIPQKCDTVVMEIDIAAYNAHYFYDTDQNTEADTLRFALDEDVSGDFCLNIFDVEEDPYYISFSLNEGDYGTLSDSDVNDNCVSYAPAENQFGVAYYEIQVCDTEDDICNSSILEITINPLNDAPVITDGSNAVNNLSFTTDMNSSLEICLNAYDVDGDNVIVETEITDGNTLGSISGITGLCFDYTPPTDQIGTDEFSIVVVDDGSPTEKDTVDITITIESINIPPEIIDEETNNPIDTVEFTINADSQLNYCITFNDPNTSDELAIVDVDTLTGDSKVSYANNCVDIIPRKTSEGLEYYKAILCDDGIPEKCDTIVIALEVTAYNAHYFYTIDQRTEADTIRVSTDEDVSSDFCLNIFDVEDDAYYISYTLNEGDYGTLSDADVNDNCVNYAPTQNQFGVAYYEIQVCDAGDDICSSSILEITIDPVNDPPVITDGTSSLEDVSYSVDINSTLNICLEAEDVENNAVSVEKAITEGSLKGTISNTNGLCFDYTAPLDEIGTDQFQIVVMDDNSPVGRDTVNVTIEIQSINSPPEVIDEQTNTPIDTVFFSVAIDATLNECLSIEDENTSDNLSISEFKAIEGVSTVTLPDDLCFEVTPNENSEAEEFYEVIVCDDGVPSLCDTVIVALNINRPPTPVDEFEQEIDSLFFSITQDSVVEQCISILDYESNEINFDSFQLNEGDGQFNGSLDGSDNLCFTYQSNKDSTDYAVVEVNFCDDGNPALCNKLNIVLDINIPPAIVDPELQVLTDSIYLEINEDESYSDCIKLEDLNGDDITVGDFNLVSGDGNLDIQFDNLTKELCIQFDPVENQYGQVEYEIEVCDDGDPSTCINIDVVFDIIPINETPQFISNSAPVDTLVISMAFGDLSEQCVSVVDEDNDNMSLSDFALLEGEGEFDATYSSDVCFSFRSTDVETEEAVARLTICDDGEPDSECKDLFVIYDINIPPRITDGQVFRDSVYYEIVQNQTLSECLGLSDLNNDQVIIEEIRVVSGSGNFSSSIENQNICFEHETKLDDVGENHYEVVYCDNGTPVQSSVIDVVVNVIPEPNTPPTFRVESRDVDTVRLEVVENTALEACINLFDQQDHSISISELVLEQGEGTITNSSVTEQYCFNFQSPELYFGEVIYSMQLCDSGEPSLCKEAVIVIDVLPVNDPPLAENDTFQVSELNQGYQFNLLENDIDPEGEGLTLDQILENPVNGSIEIISDSLVLYTPTDSTGLVDSFVYSSCDLGVPQVCVEAEVYIRFDEPIANIKTYQTLSPNNDGINDTWIIDGIASYPNNSVKIFDQWNNLIYTRKGYNNSDKVWSGQKQGLINNGPADDGVYFYVIDPGDGSRLLSGFVVLKR